MTQCAIHGPRSVLPGQAVRVDVVVSGAPAHRALRIRLEQVAPAPRAHVDEWTAVVRREGTTTVSFLWRAMALPGSQGEAPAMLRATVWDRELLGACTHTLVVGKARRAQNGAAREVRRGSRPARNGHPHPLLHQGRGLP
jgi:hypothetical protein